MSKEFILVPKIEYNALIREAAAVTRAPAGQLTVGDLERLRKAGKALEAEIFLYKDFINDQGEVSYSED